MIHWHAISNVSGYLPESDDNYPHDDWADLADDQRFAVGSQPAHGVSLARNAATAARCSAGFGHGGPFAAGTTRST